MTGRELTGMQVWSDWRIWILYAIDFQEGRLINVFVHEDMEFGVYSCPIQSCGEIPLLFLIMRYQALLLL